MNKVFRPHLSADDVLDIYHACTGRIAYFNKYQSGEKDKIRLEKLRKRMKKWMDENGYEL